MLTPDFAVTADFAAFGDVAWGAQALAPGTDVSGFILTRVAAPAATASFGVFPSLAVAAGVFPVAAVFADAFTLLSTAPADATIAGDGFVFVFTAVASGMADSGFTLATGALGDAAAMVVLLLGMDGALAIFLTALSALLGTLAALLAAAVEALAATGGVDEAFAAEGEAFEVVLAEALAGAVVLAPDPRDERAEDVFVADIPDFASFFEDAILVAPSRPGVETSRCSVIDGARRAEYS